MYNSAFHWIVFYQADSVIHHLKNWGHVYKHIWIGLRVKAGFFSENIAPNLVFKWLYLPLAPCYAGQG